MMRLPGGVRNEGEHRRDAAFRPLTGAEELVLAEIAGADLTVPERVTRALAATLEHIGGVAPTVEVVAALCVADRQYLMRQLAALLGRSEDWFTISCSACGEPFDFAVHHADLPVKEAGDSYPFALVETSLGACRFRAPIGADQATVAGVDDEADARRLLIAECLVAGPTSDGAAPEPDAFTGDDIDRIGIAMEAMAPEVCTEVQPICPACGAVHMIEVDPYVALDASTSDELLQEIHVLASAYHWGEGEILSLPLGRRRRYLELVDRARGMMQ